MTNGQPRTDSLASGLLHGLRDPALIEQDVRDQLASSLSHIRSVLGPHSPVSDDALGKVIAQIRGYRQPPGVMARYFDLIQAVQSQNIEMAERLCVEMHDLGREPAVFSVVRYDPVSLGDDFERLPRLVFAETQGRHITTPSDEAFVRANGDVLAALDIIAQTDPRVRSEIDALCSRVILAGGKREDGSATFGGVTSLLAWGCMFLNIDAQRDLNSIVMAMTHEITHATLLGLSAVEPLVNNPPHQNYTSPLRPDARPMDGLYHATIVCARMSNFSALWSHEPGITAADREQRESNALRTRAKFYDAKHTVDESGDLSKTGRDIIDECDAVISQIG
ncbi:MAG: HEXXH motif-containing putative peptide modification protein [Pseudomonadota bacterium]